MSQISNLANVLLPTSKPGHDKPAQRHDADKSSESHDDRDPVSQDQSVGREQTDSADRQVQDRPDRSDRRTRRDNRDSRNDRSGDTNVGSRREKDVEDKSRTAKTDDDKDVVQSGTADASEVAGSFAEIIQRLVAIKEGIDPNQPVADVQVPEALTPAQLLAELAPKADSNAAGAAAVADQNVDQGVMQKIAMELLKSGQTGSVPVQVTIPDTKADQAKDAGNENLAEAFKVASDPKNAVEPAKTTIPEKVAETVKPETVQPKVELTAAPEKPEVKSPILQQVAAVQKEQVGQVQEETDSRKSLVGSELKEFAGNGAEDAKKVTPTAGVESQNTQTKQATQQKKSENQHIQNKPLQSGAENVAAAAVKPAVAESQPAKQGEFQAQLASQIAQATAAQNQAAVQNAGQSAAAAAQKVQSSAFASPADQLENALNMRVVKAGDQITVRLDPPELGQIKLTVHTQGNQVRAVLEVSNPAVLDELKRDSSHVLASLADSGVNMNKIDVRLSDQSSTSQQYDQQRQAGQGDTAGQGARQQNDRQPEKNLYSRQGQEQPQATQPELVDGNTINVVI